MNNANVGSNNDDWEKHWDEYAESASNNPGQIMRHRLILSVIKKQPKKDQMKFLDIGSGQGDLLKIVALEMPKVKLGGIELAQKGVEITKRKVPTATVLAGDIFHPKKELEKFKGWATHGACSEVLEHVDDPVEFLKQSAKYLSPNAKLIITVPGGPMSKFDRHIGHRQHFDRSSITKVLQKAGFFVEKVRLVGFPFFNLYRLLVIARGDKLIADVRKSSHGSQGKLATVVMAILRILFNLNMQDSIFGWQVLAIASAPKKLRTNV